MKEKVDELFFFYDKMKRNVHSFFKLTDFSSILPLTSI